jgi:hypothetical protein
LRVSVDGVVVGEQGEDAKSGADGGGAVAVAGGAWGWVAWGWGWRRRGCFGRGGVEGWGEESYAAAAEGQQGGR